MLKSQFEEIKNWFEKIYSQNSYRFFNRVTLMDLIVIIFTAIGLVVALISMNYSRKAIDISVKAIEKSDFQDSINRVNDSLFFITDTTYKGEVKRLQDNQQKLLNDLVNLTDTIIKEKRYSDRPIIEAVNFNFSFDSTKYDRSNLYYYSTLDYYIYNVGIRLAKNIKVKEYYLTEGSSQVFFKNITPFESLSNKSHIGYSTVPIVENIRQRGFIVVFLYLVITWDDSDNNKSYSHEIVISFSLINGKFNPTFLSKVSLDFVKNEILSRKNIDLGKSEYSENACYFYPGRKFVF